MEHLWTFTMVVLSLMFDFVIFVLLLPYCVFFFLLIFSFFTIMQGEISDGCRGSPMRCESVDGKKRLRRWG
jgi:uncharacterized membrane protein